MTTINSVTAQLVVPNDTIAANRGQQFTTTAEATAAANKAAADKAAAEADGKPVTSAAAPASATDSSGKIIGPSTPRAAQPGQPGRESADDGDSIIVKTIKDQIAALQKQLAAVMQQIQSVESGSMDERAKTNALSGLQAQATSLSSSLQQAMAKLADIMGKSTGNVVDTTA